MPQGILQSALSQTVPNKTRQNEVMKYLKMKCRHVFVETMVEPILQTLQHGPIDLLVGKFTSCNRNQEIIKAVIMVAGISVDNEEAFKCQGLSFGSKCHSNCRLCTMPSKEFYTFSTLLDIYDDPSISEMSSTDIIDTYNNINAELYPVRNSIDNMTMATSSEFIWWKQVLFNKNKRVRGDKKIRLPEQDLLLLKKAKLHNLKPIGNNILSGVLWPFYTRFGIREHRPIIQPDLCFPPDKLHSFDKGVVEYTLKHIVSLLLLFQKQEYSTYGHNMSIIDRNFLCFDIYQPLSFWGNIPQRRIPGISGMFFSIFVKYFYTSINIKCCYFYTLGTYTFEINNLGKPSQNVQLTGGMIEASRMIEYLFQLIYSIPKNGNNVLPSSIRQFQFQSGHTTLNITYNPLQVCLDATFCCLSLHLLLSRKYYTEKELMDMERLITLTQISVHRLFTLKQLVSNSTNGTTVLKSHILFHFVQSIRTWGFPKILMLIKLNQLILN